MICVIPAAGYGTRSKAKLGQSKEMLPDPGYKRQPIIQYSLDLCKAFKMDPLVITREEKQDLRQYLFNKGVKFRDIKVEGEWRESVLKSKDYWSMFNMLILPDTRFTSFKCIMDIQRGLDIGNNAVMALHRVKDPENWGCVWNNTLYEKSRCFPEVGEHWAWGLMGWQKNYGQELFSNVSSLILRNVGFTYLDKFEDITRDKK